MSDEGLVSKIVMRAASPPGTHRHSNAMYSEKVKSLVANRPNCGPLEGATHRSRVEHPVCGDLVCLELKIVEGVVESCRFQADGCAASVAAAAAVTELVKGQDPDFCRMLNAEAILDFLGGLPQGKVHGARIAAEALHAALK